MLDRLGDLAAGAEIDGQVLDGDELRVGQNHATSVKRLFRAARGVSSPFLNTCGGRDVLLPIRLNLRSPVTTCVQALSSAVARWIASGTLIVRYVDDRNAARE